MASNREKRAAFKDLLRRTGLTLALDDPFVREAEEIFGYSDFIYKNCCRDPEILYDLVNSGDLFARYRPGDYVKRVAAVFQECRNEENGGKALRALRQREMIRIAWRDLSRRADLFETMSNISSFAETCVDKSLEYLFSLEEKKYGTPMKANGHPQRMVALGMGKLGAGELNFSSDIDLLFAFPESGHTRGGNKTISDFEFFNHHARRFLKFFSRNSTHGPLFRVDLRLRPMGENGPLTMSFNAMEEYYQRQGRNWERYALVKARVISGAKKDGRHLMEVLKPFVYRKYLDYGAVDALRKMKESIHLENGNGPTGLNIKTGKGGIREIEFFGQVFQLIRGGLTPQLHERNTLAVLQILVDEGVISARILNDLTPAYIFLRRTEHRLQEMDDRQTHAVPTDPHARKILAHSMGFANYQRFEKSLFKHMGNVHYHFSRLLVSHKKNTTADKACRDLAPAWHKTGERDKNSKVLGDYGYASPHTVLDILHDLKNSRQTRSLEATGIRRLDRLVPLLLEKAAGSNNPDTALARLADLVKALEKRICYLSLLIENPTVLNHLVRLAVKSPWIIVYLSRHPVLLDELIDDRTLFSPPDKTAMEKELNRRMDQIEELDYELFVHELCRFKQIHILRIAAADISGNFPLIQVSHYLTGLAELIIEKIFEYAWNQLVDKYGLPPGIAVNNPKESGFAIIGYGKLGSFEMGYGSDLDLVFLYARDGRVKGSASITSDFFYSRLGQRIIHCLSIHTAAGILYETDLRLRPGGRSGLIVSSVASFENYHHSMSDTWEHQAMIRARALCGDPKIAKRFESIREKVLLRGRNHPDLARDVKQMREKMRKERLKCGNDTFDLKEGPGGIVDIEFLVQYLVLKHIARHRELLSRTDNIRLMETLESCGILDHPTGSFLKNTYLLFRSQAHRSSLMEKSACIDNERFRDLGSKVTEIWNTLVT